MQKLQLEPLKLETLIGETAKPSFPYIDTPEEELQPQLQSEEETPDRVNELEQMLAEAQDRMALLEREAYDKAYAAGEKAGMELGRKRAEQILARMDSLLAQANEQLGSMHRSLSEAVVDIAGSLTEWLVGDIVEADRARLLAVAERVAMTMPPATELKLAVHPDDLNKFEKILGSQDSPWPLLADPALITGTARLFTDQQDVLLDPQSAVADAIEHLKKELLATDASASDSQTLE